MEYFTSNNDKCGTYTALRNGAIGGAVMGAADVCITKAYDRRQYKKVMDTYKKASFAEKKSALQALKDTTIPLKEYKNIVEKAFSAPTAKEIASRSLIYGGILGTVGLLLDIKAKNKELYNK